MHVFATLIKTRTYPILFCDRSIISNTDVLTEGVTKDNKEMDSTNNTGILEIQEHSDEDSKLFPGKYQYYIFTCVFQKVLGFYMNSFMELGIKTGGLGCH